METTSDLGLCGPNTLPDGFTLTQTLHLKKTWGKTSKSNVILILLHHQLDQH